MRKFLLFAFFLFLLLAGFFAYTFFRPAVHKGDIDGQYLYIRTGENMEGLKNDLREQHYISGGGFNLVCRIIGFKKPRPGRYKIRNGMSLFQLVRMLRNGRQEPVRMVIIKERTKELFAGRFGRGRKYDSETDSLQMIRFLNDPDSLKKYGLDTNTVMAAIIPLTYESNWNSSPSRLFKQFFSAYSIFWNKDRLKKCEKIGYDPIEVTTIASIVEEETNLKEDKYKIASTYLNRLKIGMRLQADPTVKFALKDFSLRRIMHKHLEVNSPFNTYLYAGIPPGPICTPSAGSIDAVLDAPETDYLYFVASDRFDGSSVFTSNLDDHQKYAKAYQKALTARLDSISKARTIK
jgi:UPF0755 protein